MTRLIEYLNFNVGIFKTNKMETIIKIKIKKTSDLKLVDIDTRKEYSEEKCKQFNKDLYERVIEAIKKHLDSDTVEEFVMDYTDELHMEDFESLEDYGIEIKLE